MWSLRSLNENKRSTEGADDEKAPMEAKIGDVERMVKSFTERLEARDKTIADMQAQISKHTRRSRRSRNSSPSAAT